MKNHNVDWILLLFLWLLNIIAQAEISLKKKRRCGLDVAFVSMVTGEYSPMRGLIKEKNNMDWMWLLFLWLLENIGQ